MQPGITPVPDPPALKWATKSVTAPASMALPWEWRAADLATSSRSHVGRGVEWICRGCCGNARHCQIQMSELGERVPSEAELW